MGSPTDGSKTFDLRVHHRDPKSGKIMRVNPYLLKISRENGHVYERDGVEYYPNGDLVHPPQRKVFQMSDKKEIPVPQVKSADEVLHHGAPKPEPAGPANPVDTSGPRGPEDGGEGGVFRLPEEGAQGHSEQEKDSLDAKDAKDEDAEEAKADKKKSKK